MFAQRRALYEQALAAGQSLAAKVQEQAATIHRLEETLRLHAEVFARFREDLHLERERYDALLKEVLQLRRDGFNPAAVPFAPPAPVNDPLPDKVIDAIRFVSQGQPGLARTLRTDARRLLDDGADADEVEKAILRGTEPEVAP